MMKNILVFILLIILSITVKAQIYSVPNPYVNINKTTDFGVLHEYIQINNLTTQPFPMRWVATIGGCPTGWLIGIADPDSSYTTLNTSDSAVFMLSDTNINNKLIISVTHNGFIGQCTVDFRIYPLSDSTDITLVGFSITVAPGSSTGVNSYIPRKDNVVFPNPTNGIFNIKEGFKKAMIYNSVGQLLLESTNNKIDISKYMNGFYFLKLEDASNNITTIKLVKN